MELPLYLKLSDLYEHFISEILPIASGRDQNTDENFSIETKLEQVKQVETLQKQLKKLKSNLKTEKQFNRKVELNKKIQLIENDLNKLMN